MFCISVVGLLGLATEKVFAVANAISRRMTRELDHAFDKACADESVKCILLRGEGKHFSRFVENLQAFIFRLPFILNLCSGHDLGSDAALSDTVRPQEMDPRPRGEYLKWFTNDVEACLKWRHLRKPGNVDF